MTIHDKQATIVSLLLLSLFFSAAQADNWPQWRGPAMNGISTEKNLPVNWSPTENVTWKLETSAWSGATPIIWNDHIFLNMADGTDSPNLSLWCVDRNTGKVLWKQPLGAGSEVEAVLEPKQAVSLVSVERVRHVAARLERVDDLLVLHGQSRYNRERATAAVGTHARLGGLDVQRAPSRRPS